MQRIKCQECGKNYDFDSDDFCPKCGAFNQPGREAQINTSAVIRVDGLNEQGHKGSFVHRELHAEDRIRRAVKLEQNKRSMRNVQQVRRDEMWRERKKNQGGRVSGLKTVYFFLIVIVLLRIIYASFF